MFGPILHSKESLAKSFLRKKTIILRGNRGRTKLNDKLDKHKIEELKEMVKEKEPNEPVENVLAVFCERHGLSLGTCRYYYNILLEKGEIKEK
jgi:hypothetical protein